MFSNNKAWNGDLLTNGLKIFQTSFSCVRKEVKTILDENLIQAPTICWPDGFWTT